MAAAGGRIDNEDYSETESDDDELQLISFTIWELSDDRNWTNWTKHPPAMWSKFLNEKGKASKKSLKL
jgi:hypothetical protein